MKQVQVLPRGVVLEEDLSVEKLLRSELEISALDILEVQQIRHVHTKTGEDLRCFDCDSRLSLELRHRAKCISGFRMSSSNSSRWI